MRKALAALLIILFVTAPVFCAFAEEETLAFTTTDLNGNVVDESFLEGYKIVLFNVWEPWCGYCVAEMPILEKLYREYREKGLLVIGLVNRLPYPWLKPEETIRNTGITYPVLNYCGDFDSLFPEASFPVSAFADGEGRILNAYTPLLHTCIPLAREEAALYAAGGYDIYLNDPAYAGYRSLFELLKAAAEGDEAQIEALAAYMLSGNFCGTDAFYGRLSDTDWEYLIGEMCKE